MGYRFRKIIRIFFTIILCVTLTAGSGTTTWADSDAGETTEKPVEVSAEETAEESAEKPAEEVTEEPAEEAIEKTEEPAGESTEKTEEPAGESTEKTEESAGEPTEESKTQDTSVNWITQIGADQAQNCVSGILSQQNSPGGAVNVGVIDCGTHLSAVTEVLKQTGGSYVNVITYEAQTDEYGNPGLNSVAEGIRYLMSDGLQVQVINISAGFLGGVCPDSLSSAINDAYAKGIAVVCAAGNNNSAEAVYPADLQTAIGVIGLDTTGDVWIRYKNSTDDAVGSNYGNGKEIAAPAVGITTAAAGIQNGTSFSAPMVSGTVALMLAVNPDLTIPEIRNILASSASDVLTTGYDDESGYGCINASGAVAAAIDMNDSSETDLGNAEVTGISDSYSYTGSVICPEVTVSLNGTVLTKNVDYTISFENNLEVSSSETTGIVTISAIEGSGYTGTKQVPFEIVPCDLSQCTVKILGSCAYTGEPVEPDVKVGYGSLTLTKGIDYSVSYENNIGPGEASLIVTALDTSKGGSGHYTGSITKVFQILNSDDLKDSGTTNGGLTWKLYGDGRLTIDGSGNIAAYAKGAEDDWLSYRDEITSVQIGDGITAVGDYAFDGCEYIERVQLPDTVTKIGVHSFSDCTSLKEINIPGVNNEKGTGGVSEINKYAFAGCTSLQKIVIPRTVTKLNEGMFDGCASLADIELPETIRKISQYVFKDCTSLEEINLPDDMTGGYISGFAFKNCTSLKKIVFPYGLTQLYNQCFYGCSSLESIDIPDTVKTLGDSVFYGCASLKSIYIPDGVTYLPDRTFSNCTALTFVDLPEGITGIGTCCFEKCASLSKITLPESLTYLGDRVFYAAGLTEIEIPDGVETLPVGTFRADSLLQKVTLHDTLKTIKDDCFQNCSSLTELNIPDSVETICKGLCDGCTALETVTLPDTITSLSENMFRNCTSLKDIEIPDTVESLEARAFYGCTGLEEITLPFELNSIKEGCFSGCTGLKQMDFPEGITDLPANVCADCSLLESVQFSSNLKTIGASAFENCDALKNVEFPENIVSIGSRSFRVNSGAALTEVTVPDADPAIYITGQGEKNSFNEEVTTVNLKTVNRDVLSGTCGESASWVLDKDGALVISGTGTVDAIADWKIKESGDTETEISISDVRARIVSCIVQDGIESIGKQAFLNCTNMESIQLPQGDSLTTIGDGAFYNCRSLKKLILPSSLEKLGKAFCYGCINLEVCDPADFSKIKVTEIPAYAFAYCEKLTDFHMPSNLVTVGNYAFAHCSSLASVVTANTMKTIGEGAFSSCTSLKKISFHYALETIGKGAFYGCSSLASVETATTKVLKEIGESAFSDCTSLTYIFIPNTVVKIGDRAFASCTSLEELRFGSEDSSLLNEIGSYAFFRCEKLSTIYGFENQKNLQKIGEYAFFGCDSISQLLFPQSGKLEIGTFAFAMSDNLESVQFQNASGQTVSLGDYAFYSCSALANVIMPGKFSNDEIGEGVFALCSSLKTAEGLNEAAPSKIGAYAFYGDTSLSLEAVPSSVTTVGRYAFSGVHIGNTDGAPVDEEQTAYLEFKQLLDSDSRVDKIWNKTVMSSAVDVMSSVSNCQVIASDGSSVGFHAPGSVLIRITDASGAEQTVRVNVAIPIEASWENYYRETTYEQNPSALSEYDEGGSGENSSSNQNEIKNDENTVENGPEENTEYNTAESEVNTEDKPAAGTEVNTEDKPAAGTEVNTEDKPAAGTEVNTEDKPAAGTEVNTEDKPAADPEKNTEDKTTAVSDETTDSSSKEYTEKTDDVSEDKTTENSADSDDRNTDNKGTVNNDSANNGLLLFVLIAVIILAAMILIIIGFRKKRKRKN